MPRRTDPNSERSQIAQLAKQIADHQARIQVIAANWAEMITEHLNATEKKLLAKIAKELKDFQFNHNAKETLTRLKRIHAQLRELRLKGWQEAYRAISEEALALAENEAKWAQRIAKETSSPEDAKKLHGVSDAKLEKVVKFGLADGKTAEEYFHHLAEDEAVRLESSIRQGVESGWTIDQMTRNLAGTAENNYTDGILEISRKAATLMARTLTNAIANHAKDAFYQDNADIIPQVEILSTLDGRTCVAKGECVLTPSGEVPIENIKPGDMVIGGSRAARRVSHTTKKVVNSTLRITLSNGRTIRCTRDHLLLLKNGEWREAGDLREGDEIAEQL